MHIAIHIMKRILMLLLAPILLMACQSNTKQKDNNSADSTVQNLPVSSDSDPNLPMVKAYLNLGKSLYEQDQDKIMETANTFAQILSSQQPDKLPADSKEDIKDIVDNTKENIQHIIDSKNNLIHQREHYEIISEDMYDYIKLQDTKHTLYKFDCKQGEKPQIWLSDTKEVHNPYLGREKQACGTLTETLNE